MKKGQNLLFITLLFYLLAGSCACVLFYVKSEKSRETMMPDAMNERVIGTIDPEENSEEIAIETEEVQDAGDEETAAAAESETEALPEPETEEETAQKKYYKFSTVNKKGGLRVREAPSMEAETSAKLPPSTTGYVLEQGTVWSLITTGDVTGYAFNEYLKLEEIPEEEFPKQYR